jgi:hypothetical protein
MCPMLFGPLSLEIKRKARGLTQVILGPTQSATKDTWICPNCPLALSLAVQRKTRVSIRLTLSPLLLGLTRKTRGSVQVNFGPLSFGIQKKTRGSV